VPAAKLTTAERKTRPPVSAAEAVFQLENGARMDQATFHELYLQTPEGFRAELIGGTVYVMASPTSLRHSRPHARVVHWLCLYSDETPGTDVLDNTTSVLGSESEPQPDACLVLQPEYGGQTRTRKDDMLVGAPELVVEVANTTRAIDLGRKKADYEKAGVKEYVVVLATEQNVVWFARGSAGFAEIGPGADGLLRSELFPGLWLDPRGFFDPSARALSAAIRRGHASPEHAAFVAELATRKKAAAKKPRKSK